MNLSRHWIRRILFERAKVTKTRVKELRKGSLLNSLTTSLQKILLSAAGITVFASPLMGATQSSITPVGSNTKISYDDAKKIHTITTDKISGKNAFNAFKTFTLTSGEMANLYLPTGTENLLNFVGSKINISGTVNAIKNSNIGGNLYFLSSQGLILNKGGVINAGAFFAMTPHQSIMDHILTDTGINLKYSEEIDDIINCNLANRNKQTYTTGATIAPDGQIFINGTINTLNGIGLYAGGHPQKESTTGGVKIGSTGQLNTLSTLAGVVNVEGITAGNVDLVADAGNIEIVSLSDTQHDYSAIGKYVLGYANAGKLFTSNDVKKAYAEAKVDVEAGAKINSRKDVVIDAIATNGQLSVIKPGSRSGSYAYASNFANVNSKINLNGTINATGNVTVNSVAENVFSAGSVTVLNLGLTMLGMATPLNFNGYFSSIEVSSELNLNKNSTITAGKEIKLKSDAFSKFEAGFSTASIMTKQPGDGGPWLPSVDAVVTWNDAKSILNLDGTIKSNATSASDGNIGALSVAENRINISSTCSNAQQDNPGIALAIGIGDNSATLNVNKDINIQTIGDIDLKAYAENRPIIKAVGSVGNNSYGAVSVAASDYTASAAVNIYGNITPANQKGKLNITALNNSYKNTLSAGTSAGLGKIAQIKANNTSNLMGGIFQKVAIGGKHFMSFMQDTLPANSDKNWNAAGALGIADTDFYSKIYVAPSVKIETAGNLTIESNTNIEDMQMSVNTGGQSGVFDTNGNKSSYAAAVLWDNVIHKSDVIIDDSPSNKKGSVKGSTVSITSNVSVPYNRIGKMVEELEWAVTVLKANASGEKQKALVNNLVTVLKKIKDNATGFAANKAFTGDSISAFWDLLMTLGVSFPSQLMTFATEEFSIVTSAIEIVRSALGFASYNNYFNISASSGTSTGTEQENSNSFAGSVILAWVDEKNNLLIGRNNNIQSVNSIADKEALKINATNDSNILTIAGTPLLTPVAGVNTLGGSFAYENFNSVAETVIAQGTAIISDKANNMYIASSNNTDGAIAGLAASMGTSGFDAMGAYISGDQHANVYIDDGVSLTGKKIDVNAYNDTEITNVAGAVIVSKGKGVGVGFALNNLDKETQVLFGDYEKYWHDKRVALGLAKESEAYGSTTVNATQTAHVFNAVAKTTGTINSVGVAGGLTVNSDSDEKGKFGKFCDKIKSAGKWVSDKKESLINWGTNKLASFLNLGDFNKIAENRAIPEPGQAGPAQPAPEFSFHLAGSTALNFIDNTTKVDIKNANFVLDGSKSSIDATAINSGHALSFAGAAGIMYQTATQAQSKNSTTVGLAGDVALNSIDNNTSANIENSKVRDANDINISTINGGETIAAGLALEVAVNGDNAKHAYSYTPEFSINLIDNNISATAKNNTINGGVSKSASASGQSKYLADTNLNVTAFESDTQVEGGVSINIGKQKCSAGTSIDIGIASNTLNASIIGGSYNQMGNVGANTLQASTQVNAGLAVSGAIAVAAGAEGKNVAFTGVGAYSEINNQNSALIKDSVISAKGNVTVVSEDTKSSSDIAKPYQDKLKRNDNEISFIDKEGKSYYEGINPATGTQKLSDISADREGSLIVTTGVSVPVGGIPVGLGAAISTVKNEFKADVDNSDITANKLVANANNKTVIYDIAAGAALSTQEKLGAGGGSAAWSTITNTAKTTIASSTFKLNEFDAVSANNAYIHSGAGQLAASLSGGKGGVGAAFAFNRIDNTANSIVYGGSITGTASNTSKINVLADNYGHIVDVAFSAAAGDKVDFAGTLTINELKNNSVAQLGDSKKKKVNVKDIGTTNILATDSAKIFSLSGAIDGSKDGGIGGAVAVNTISGSTKTLIENADIDTKALNMKAYSNSKNLAIAIGAGGAGKIAFDGASTANTIDRNVYANITSANIQNASATADIQAISDATTDGRAVVAVGSGKVAIGAGVSVNRLYGEVATIASDTTFVGKEFVQKAISNQYISNVSVQGSGAGNTGISGSFAYNDIDYDTTAKIKNSNVTASDSVAVVAQSDDSLMNYAGILAIGGQAGVGVSLSLDYISGDTKAVVEDSTIVARGLDSSKKMTLNNKVNDSYMFDTFIATNTISINDHLGKHRSSTGAMSGLIVDSSSTHTMKSFVAGVAVGTGSGLGSVNVNTTDGETSAVIKNSTVNKGYNGSTAGDINVHAGDYTNTASFIGQIALAGTGALGISADTNKVDRDSIARIDGLKSGSVAKNVNVNAESKQGISSVVAGIAGTGTGAVAGNIDVGLSIATTTAEIVNSKLSLNSADVNANHRSRSHIIAGTGAVGIGGAGVGATVVVTNDKNHINARIANSTIDINSGMGGDINVNATNDDKFDVKTGTFGAGLYAGVAGSVVVDYMENHVLAQVETSNIGSTSNRAKSISINASDTTNNISQGGALGIGAGAVGAAVNVNTLDGSTKADLNNAKLYAQNDVELSATETRNGNQFGLSAQGGVGAVGATVLVVNAGKKYDLTDSGSKDVNEDTNKAIEMAKTAMAQGKVGKPDEMTEKEYNKIMSKDMNYVATTDGKSVTATNIIGSTIDSKSGRLQTDTSTNGYIEMNCTGVAGGLGAVMGTFGYIYDNKNVLTNIDNSTITTNGIKLNSVAQGTSEMLMAQGSAGIGDYSGAFAFNKISGNTFVDVRNSTLTSTNRDVDLKAYDKSKINTTSIGIMFGGVSVGTIFAEAENDSKAVVNIADTTIKTNTYNGAINIAASRENEVFAEAIGGDIAVGAVDVVRPYAGDEGGSHINLKSGNEFTANKVNASIYDHQELTANMSCVNGGGIGVGVGNVDANEESRSDFLVATGSKYLANVVDFSAISDSEVNEESNANTISIIDIKANRAESNQKSTVNMEVAVASYTFKENTILNISADNDATAKVKTDGICGGVISIANSKSTAKADLTTNVKIIQSGADTTNLKELNVSSSSEVTHNLYSNGDGGGLVNISPYSAQTYSKMTINNNVEMSGNISADKIRADAKSKTNSNTTAEAYQVSVIAGGSGTDGETDINLNTGVKIGANSVFTANEIIFNSTNDINTGYFENKKHNVKGKGEGLISGTGDDSKHTINATSTVTIEKNANLIAENALKLNAHTKTDLKNAAVATGRGLGSHPDSTSKNTVTLNNVVTTGQGSLLKTTEEETDINIATNYDFKTDYSAYTEVEGAGAGSTDATVDYTFKLKNNININGSIYSFHDAKLYAGKKLDGSDSIYNIKVSAEALTRSIIAWDTSANLDADITRENNINIGSTGKVETVEHAYLSAKTSNLDYSKHSKEYNWWRSDTDDTPVTTTSAGNANENIKENNSINVDGSVIAGIHNKLHMTIDGKVSLHDDVSFEGMVDKPTITCDNEQYKNEVKWGLKDYANKLYDRYKEVEQLCIEYAGTKVGLNYQAEKTRLKNEMLKYNLYDPKGDAVIGSMMIDYVEIPEMVGSGGNIYIEADEGSKVTGKGMLQAKGAPEIVINNNSNMYMIVNDLTIEVPGGDIVLNDVGLGNKAQSTLRVAKSLTDSATGSKIEVNENWKATYDVKYKDDDGKTQTLTSYAPLTNVEINGHIRNEEGSVVIYNAKKDIILQGKTARDTASINGATISLSAPNGSISQGYSQGITNVGYTPDIVLKEWAKSKENAISAGITATCTKDIYESLTEEQLLKYVEEWKKKNPDDAHKSEGGVWIAGDEVYLNGDDLNINGLLQSGYADYKLTIENSAATQNRINEIISKYESNQKPEITEAYLEQNCMLNEGGMLWNESKGCYEYVVQAYFNPETKKIILEEVEAGGGKIYLTGRISNTGGGKILAADGAANITVDNKTSYELETRLIDAGNREGLISITDLAKDKDPSDRSILGTQTEMRTSGTKTWYLVKESDLNKPDKETSTVASKYDPLSGLTYTWTTGYETLDEYRHEESYKFLFWGGIDYGKKTTDTLRERIEKNEIPPKHLENTPLKIGSLILTDVNLNGKEYTLNFNKYLNQEYGPETGGRTEYNTFFHASGTHYSWSVLKKGGVDAFQHSIKADYPISVGFLSGDGNIGISNVGNLTLMSDIITNSGKVNLTSSKGAIEQKGGVIKANNVFMNADTGIGAQKAIEQKLSANSGTFSAITNTGDVNARIKSTSGNISSEVKLTAVTNKGNVNVIADASLITGGTGLDVKGDRINLESTGGSIGKSNAALKIQAGQTIVKPGDTLSASINATALKDVSLNQTAGDMRIGKIVSRTGDVYLTTAGSFLDALPPKGEEIENKSAEELIAKWKELGIIAQDGKDNSAQHKQAALADYKSATYSSFNRYLELKKYFSANPSEKGSATYEEYQTLKKSFGSYATADKWLDAQLKDENSEWYALNNTVAYGWTQNELLYALQESIINKESGSSIDAKTKEDANIKGRNITLTAGKGIGRDEGSKIVDITNLQTDAGLETLKELARTEASDIKWGFAGDKQDHTKATINYVNSICIDATGALNATANGNVYLADTAGNSINLANVDAGKGNVRIYGKNGVYNTLTYNDTGDTPINIKGKDLILEGGAKSIGTKEKPVTTDMSGAVTARSDGMVNIRQAGTNNLTIAAIYSGAEVMLRALNNIYSVYNGIQADELGYINSKIGQVSLLSDTADIGQANGKGLRVYLNKDQKLSAEGNSVYIKGIGEGNLELTDITVRGGNFGLDSAKSDVTISTDLSAKEAEFNVKSLTQKSGRLTINTMLTVAALNGINLPVMNNLISGADLYNKSNGDIKLYNSCNIDIKNIANDAGDGEVIAYNFGQGDMKISKASSKNNIYVGTDNGNLNINNVNAFDIYYQNAVKGNAEDNNIKAKAAYIYTDEGNTTLSGMHVNTLYATNKVSGNITVKDGLKVADNAYLNTEKGDISIKSTEAGKNLSVITNNGSINVDGNVKASDDVTLNAFQMTTGDGTTLNSNGNINATNVICTNGQVDIEGHGNVSLKEVYAGEDVNLVSQKKLSVDKVTANGSDESLTSLIYSNLSTYIADILVESNLNAFFNESFINDMIKAGGNILLYTFNNLEIKNYIKSGKALDVISYGDGDISVKTFDSGLEASIYNSNGSIGLDSSKAGGDFTITSSGEGNININNDITTTNEGDLHISQNKGNVNLNGAHIDGNINITVEDGSVNANYLEVAKDLEVRTNNGSITIEKNIEIGFDAILAANYGSASMKSLFVGSNIIIDAYYSAIVEEAMAGMSMIVNTIEGDIKGSVIKVGQNIYINTDKGSIDVARVNADNNANITIDHEDGGSISINNITVGKDFKGDLIVDSESSKLIEINNAMAANKMIINGSGDINLQSATTFGGLLEVKAGHDVVAECLESASRAFIVTLNGNIYVDRILTNGLLGIVSVFGGDIFVNAIEANNGKDGEEGTIDIGGYNGNVYINNASASQDINVVADGTISLNNSNAGNDIGFIGNGAYIEADNINASNNIVILGENAKFFLRNMNAGQNVDIISINSAGSASNINAGNEFGLIGGNSDLTCNSINAGSHIELLLDEGKYTFRGLDTINMSVKNNADTSLSDSSAESINIDNKLSLNLDNIDFSTFEMNNDKGSMLTARNLRGDALDLNNSGNAELDVTGVTDVSMKNTKTGVIQATNIISDSWNFENEGSAAIASAKTVNVSITNGQGANLEINNLKSDELTLNNSGNASFDSIVSKNSSIMNAGKATFTANEVSVTENIALQNSGSASINELKAASGSFINYNDGNFKAGEINASTFTLSNLGKADINNIVSDAASIENALGGSLNIGNLKVEDSLELHNTGNADIDNINSGVASIDNGQGGNLNSDNLSVSNSLAINNDGTSNINNIVSGNTVINNASGASLKTGSAKVADSLTLDNSGNASFATVNVAKDTSIANGNKASFNVSEALNAENVSIENKGSVSIEKLLAVKNGRISNSKNSTLTIKELTASTLGLNNSAKASFNKITVDNAIMDSDLNGSLVAGSIKANGSLDMTNAGAATINTIETGKAVITNSGNAQFTAVTASNANIDNVHGGSLNADNIKITDALALNNEGSATIATVEAAKAAINNSGKAALNNVIARNVTVDNTSAGSLNSDNLMVSDSLTMNNAGKAKLTNVTGKNASIVNTQSGSFDTEKLKITDSLVMNNAGESAINTIEAGQVAINNAAGANFSNTKLDTTDFISLENHGNATFSTVTGKNITTKNFGSTTVKESLNAARDFNLVTDKTGTFNFKSIVTGNNLNVFADSGSLKGNSINIGNSLYAYKYSDFGKQINSSSRASYGSDNSILDVLFAKRPADKFSLVIDELNIANGLYVNNAGIEIKSNVAIIGKDADINADFEDINIKELAVDGGSLNIKGKEGSVVLGTAVIDGETNVKLDEGDFTADDLLVHRDININAGGSVTSAKSIESEIGGITIKSGDDIIAGNILAKTSDIDISSGGDFKANNVESAENGSVNLIAEGNVNAYKILAGQQGNIEAANGDIVIGEINGKTLVIREHTNHKNLKVDKMTVGDKVIAEAGNINIAEINHTEEDKPLSIELPGVDGYAMDNVTISNVITKTGVDLNGLFSHYADIHVSNRYFSLSKVYLLRNGDLSNSDTKFRLYGWQPRWSSDPDIISYFVPTSKWQWANIDFIDMGNIGKKPYIVLTAKDTYTRMFDEYTVVQQIEAIQGEFMDTHEKFMASYLDSFDLRNEFQDNLDSYKVYSDDDDEDQRLKLTSAGELIH